MNKINLIKLKVYEQFEKKSEGKGSPDFMTCIFFVSTGTCPSTW